MDKCIFVFIASMMCSNAFAIEPDKQAHLNVSAVLGAVGYTACRGANKSKKKSVYCGLIFSLTLGLAKELTDSRIDSQDLLYDVGGTAIGISIPLIVESF